MNYSIEPACSDCETQKEAAGLLGRIFPDYWEQTAAKNQGFPFDEISFAARAENGRMCGHVGVMPFSVSDGAGGILRFAGIASVAVDPDFRGHGISTALCEAAAEWAVGNGMDALPLFTGKSGVYSRHGWAEYPVHPPRKTVPPKSSAVPLRRIPAAQLSEREKARIIRFYEQSFVFPGKVLRSCDSAFHAWPRIFREPDFKFLLSDSGYALVLDGAVTELCTFPGAETELLSSMGSLPFTLALPSMHPVWEELRRDGWTMMNNPDDVYHGEGVMIRPAVSSVPRNLYFPCADKF